MRKVIAAFRNSANAPRKMGGFGVDESGLCYGLLVGDFVNLAVNIRVS